MLVPIIVGRAHQLWRESQNLVAIPTLLVEPHFDAEKYQVVDEISINSTRLQFPWFLLLLLLLLWFVGEILIFMWQSRKKKDGSTPLVVIWHHHFDGSNPIILMAEIWKCVGLIHKKSCLNTKLYLKFQLWCVNFRLEFLDQIQLFIQILLGIYKWVWVKINDLGDRFKSSFSINHPIIVLNFEPHQDPFYYMCIIVNVHIYIYVCIQYTHIHIYIYSYWFLL